MSRVPHPASVTRRTMRRWAEAEPSGSEVPGVGWEARSAQEASVGELVRVAACSTALAPFGWGKNPRTRR
jgi:hypothetical protein